MQPSVMTAELIEELSERGSILGLQVTRLLARLVATEK